MDYLLMGLMLFIIGNLTHPERVVSKMQTEIGHIKEHLQEGKHG